MYYVHFEQISGGEWWCLFVGMSVRVDGHGYKSERRSEYAMAKWVRMKIFSR